jgi:hypothetical protein
MAFAKQGVAGELYAGGIGLVGVTTPSGEENCGELIRRKSAKI